MDVADQITHYVQLAEGVYGNARVFDVFYMTVCWRHSDHIEQLFWLFSAIYSQQEICSDHYMLSTASSQRLYKQCYVSWRREIVKFCMIWSTIKYVYQSF